jgi:hypothetical protein
VSRVRLRVHWSITIIGRGADAIQNTASSTVACWTMFTELLPGNALIKSVSIFCVVFCVRKAIFIHVFLKLNNSSYFFDAICKSGPFSFWCWVSLCMFCFCGGGFSNKFVLYSLFCSIVLMVFISASFALLVVGYVCNRFSRCLIHDTSCSY